MGSWIHQPATFYVLKWLLLISLVPCFDAYRAMSFRRDISPVRTYVGDELDASLISIGVRLAGEAPKTLYNIEDVLISASVEAICDEDYRVLGLLTDWIEIHGRLINVDRLARLMSVLKSEKVRRFWKAISQWQSKDVRFRKLGAATKIRVAIEGAGRLNDHRSQGCKKLRRVLSLEIGALAVSHTFNLVRIVSKFSYGSKKSQF